MGFLNGLVKVGSLGLIDDFDGSEGAQEASTRANELSVKESRRQFDAEQEAIAPFREIGLQNFRDLNSEVGGLNLENRLDRIRSTFRTSPAYQNRLKLGTDQIEQSAVGQGTLFSGNTLKGLERFRQGLASEEFNNHANTVNSFENERLNRIASLAGAGQTANNQSIESSRNNSNNIIQAHQNQGAIDANASTAGFNSFLNVLNTGANVVRASA